MDRNDYNYLQSCLFSPGGRFRCAREDPAQPQQKASMSPTYFEQRGIVEGFYGVFYTHAERLSLIRFAGRHGYNLYVYAPKNDRYHRARWREPYPARALDELREAAAVAAESGVSFCFALSPGLTISYASEEDFAALVAKFQAIYDLGVRAFSLLLDDIHPDFRHEADRLRFGGYGEAHADLCNRIWAWLHALDPHCTLSMCPTDYATSAPFSPYLYQLGAALDPAIDVFYTGSQVCSPTITTADAEAFGLALRRPPLIWDNYPVNDGEMAAELHIGPLRGRDPLLYRAVRGICANPMNQPEASKIPLATYADYLADPEGYDPLESWERALRAAAGDERWCDLELVGENSLFSCLCPCSAVEIATLTEDAVGSLARGECVDASPAVRALEAYLTLLGDACYRLTYALDNPALRQDLLPWIELLEVWVRLAQRSLMVLRAVERGAPYDEALARMNALLLAINSHPRQIAGDGLLLLAQYALRKVQPPAELALAS